ncbi:MAG TPA: HD domain-containing protein [Gemmatimonadaceae bacterium]|nr:HD domain-containing protein [Gemmatimonadaceae bacterium]
MKGNSVTLPEWAHVSDKRRAHIGRVVELLRRWAGEMSLPDDEATRWLAAGALHDALRDAPESMLRALTGDGTRAAELLHGPAAAVRAEQDGERRQDVLDAVRHHTVGSVAWDRTGRALYMADFLEPGRKFLVAERAYLARQVPRDFDATFRAALQLRLEWSLSQGGELFPETVELWNRK